MMNADMSLRLEQFFVKLADLEALLFNKSRIA